MIYNFTKLAEKQVALDKLIKDKCPEMKDQQYWEDRIIALIVEVAELSNEIRFFKYWSNKPASDKEVILSELVDCLHFAFSLGNTIENESWIFAADDIKRPLPHIFFDLVARLHKMVFDNSTKKFKSMLNNIAEIAWHMGYTQEDIEEAYDKKNAINYQRQEEGY